MVFCDHRWQRAHCFVVPFLLTICSAPSPVSLHLFSPSGLLPPTFKWLKPLISTSKILVIPRSPEFFLPVFSPLIFLMIQGCVPAKQKGPDGGGREITGAQADGI